MNDDFFASDAPCFTVSLCNSKRFKLCLTVLCFSLDFDWGCVYFDSCGIKFSEKFTVPDSASSEDALDSGWKPHPERINQSTGSESWSRSGNVRFKRRQLGGRDGY